MTALASLRPCRVPLLGRPASADPDEIGAWPETGRKQFSDHQARPNGAEQQQHSEIKLHGPWLSKKEVAERNRMDGAFVSLPHALTCLPLFRALPTDVRHLLDAAQNEHCERGGARNGELGRNGCLKPRSGLGMRKYNSALALSLDLSLLILYETGIGLGWLPHRDGRPLQPPAWEDLREWTYLQAKRHFREFMIDRDSLARARKQTTDACLARLLAKRGRTPLGDRPMTPAERSKKYRERQSGNARDGAKQN